MTDNRMERCDGGLMTALPVTRHPVQLCLLIGAFVLMTVGRMQAAEKTQIVQTLFATPERAAAALLEATRHNDTAALHAIFGPHSNKIISSGDAAEDRAARHQFLRDADERFELVDLGTNRCMLCLGKYDWAFPIPLVRTTGGWRFATEAGREELLNRRIGHNELAAINFCHDYVDAQRDYATRVGHGAFATRFISTQGKHDGLYWPVRKGEMPSPLGHEVSAAMAAGYSQQHLPLVPYHGYYFRILTSQGPAAPGGSRDYMVDGQVRHGFALLAWPAKYNANGVMTFIINQNGIVFQKNLGKNTATAAAAITTFDPDTTWEPVHER